MLKTLAPSTKLLLAALTLALIGSLAGLSATANTCYGTYYEYYDGPNHNEIVGAKVVCPGFPDQIDCDDSHLETQWFVTETVVCPCPGGSGCCGDGENEDDGP